MKMNPDKMRNHGQAGFSLVDVMVGMVIALLGVIIMFQVFAVSEGVKRTTTGGGEALQNGASSLAAIERSLKQAGYGFFASTNLPPLPADIVGLAPLTIIASGATAPDTIVIRYRQNWDFGPFPPDPIAYASAVPPALTVETISVTASGVLMTSTAPDPAPPYPTSVPPAAATSNAISDGIVLMKAVYGIDGNGDGVAETWGQAAPADPLTVKAVRLVVVARSSQPEKPNPSTGVCDTTTVSPSWTDSTAVPLDISAGIGLNGDDWKCYRYRTFENTVPLRNN